jgi:hypothetical protein
LGLNPAKVTCWSSDALGLTNVRGRACGVLTPRTRTCVHIVQIRKHGTTKQEAKYITDKDILQDLPHRIWLNNYPFTLLEADKFTVRYRNKGNIASLLRCAATRVRVCLHVVVVVECRVLRSASYLLSSSLAPLTFLAEGACTASMHTLQCVSARTHTVLASEGGFAILTHLRT